jgi:hypothetical protein
MTYSMLFPIYSAPTTAFTEALAAASATLTPPYASSAIYSLPGVPPAGSRRFLIRSILYLAVEQVGLEFDFWGRAVGNTAVLTTDAFIARYQFVSANLAQVAGTGFWRGYVDQLAIPYFDADSANSQTPPTLHVSLSNVDTVAKSADAAGAIRCTFQLEPMMAVQG